MNQMPKSNQNPNPNAKEELKRTLEALRTLRDEIRLQIHLGSVEVKQRWRDIEPDLEKAAKLTEDANRATIDFSKELLGKVREIASLLKKSGHRENPNQR